MINLITTRSIAALAVTGAIVAGGAATANANDDGVATPERREVKQLVLDAVQDGTVTLEEEDAIKRAIEDASDVEFASLDEAAQQGGAAVDDATSGATPESSEVAPLVFDAVKNGTVTLEEEDAIKQAIEDNSDVELESLEKAVPQG